MRSRRKLFRGKTLFFAVNAPWCQLFDCLMYLVYQPRESDKHCRTQLYVKCLDSAVIREFSKGLTYLLIAMFFLFLSLKLH